VVRGTDQQVAQAGQHRSVAELELSIQDWIDTWNQNPRPFVWTKTADEILDTIAHYCQRIRDTSPHRLRRLLHQWRDAVPREDRTADLSPNSTTCWPSSPSAPGTCATRWPSTGLARCLGSTRCSPTTSRFAAGRDRTPPRPANRSQARPWRLVLPQPGHPHRQLRQGTYEGFELNAVDLTTVHRAKGLEWPAMLIPSVTASRFPTSRTGAVQD
jgi:hypothetical protein